MQLVSVPFAIMSVYCCVKKKKQLRNVNEKRQELQEERSVVTFDVSALWFLSSGVK